MKRPSFQFFHGDWRSNAKLRRLPHSMRGIWIETLCLMADSDEFGVLRWPLGDLSNAVPCRIAELRMLREKGVLKGADVGERCEALIYTPRHAGKDGDGVTLLPEQDGPIWYSSRMVRDAYIASIRGKGTRFGVAPEAEPTHRIGDGPSSSTSSSLKKPSAGRPAPTGFEDAWKAMPKRAGNNPRDRAVRAYSARLAEGAKAEDIIAGAQRYERFCAATGKTGSEFVMQGATFFGPGKAFEQPWTVATAATGEWWRTESATLAKGQEVGLKPRTGEGWNEFRERIRTKLAGVPV